MNKRATVLIMLGTLRSLAAPALLLAGALAVCAQSGQVQQLSAGKFLVARPNLPDPNFTDTVVLLIQADEEGAMGLIINRRTRLSLARVFSGLSKAQQRTDFAYMGGPVGRTGVLALLRSSKPRHDAKAVFSDVYLIADKKVLEQTVEAAVEPGVFRVYLGYSGWGAGQLQREVLLGAWHVLPGDPNLVFDPDPDSVWTRLIRRTDLQIASTRLSAAPRR